MSRITPMILLGVFAMAMLLTGTSAGGAAPATGPLSVCEANPRYFADGSGKPILLVGSHVWNNLQDMGETDPPEAFDWEAYLDFLERHNHNFVRLWRWELTMWDTKANRESKRLTCAPHPWARTGPGSALDGKPKFDLEQFDEGYFQRLRGRLESARDRGIYVSIMLFEGWGLQFVADGWRAHPFHPDNNVNGIDGDADGDGMGLEVHELVNPAVTAVQEAYVRKVVDTVNDLDNVLYEVSNENHPPSTEWQYHIINLVHEYEKTKPKQHPIGMTFQYGGGSNQALFDSPADWVSPNPDGGYRDNPPPGNGSKVVISDTDHLWGIGGNQQWVWKSFTRGLNPIFMDPYDGVVLGKRFDPQWDPIRKSMGVAVALAQRVDLAKMTPRPELASSRYCLADPGREYIVYVPEGGAATVDLSAATGQLGVEWLNPATGEGTKGAAVSGGSGLEFSAPFGGDAVLRLRATGEGKGAAAVEPLEFVPPTPIEAGFRLNVSPNRRYLVDQNGGPFLWVGDTGWYLFGALTEEEAELYLENRRQKGFNLIQCIIAYWSRGTLHASPDGHKPWIDDNPATPNEAYFQRIDRILGVAREQGIILGLLPAWGDLVLDKQTLTMENARAYGKWLGARYKDAPNVVWILGGDQPPTGFEDVFRELAAGLDEGDGGRHLTTYHPRGGGRSSDYWHTEDWLDFNMMQSGHRIDLPNYDMVLADYALQPPKPTLDGEPRYEHIINGLKEEGPRISAHQVRKAAYNAVLSGALGHTYGCSEVYRFWRPGDGGPWGPDTPWQQAMDFPGAVSMGHLKSLMISVPWHTLKPDPTLVVGGSGTGGAYAPAARSESGDLGLIYVPETQTVHVNLARIMGSRVNAAWYNPRDGRFVPVGEFPNEGLQGFAPPTGDADPDYVLVLRSAGPDRTPPQVEHVFAVGDPQKVIAFFSEPVDGESATNPANYRIDQGINVEAVSLSPDGQMAAIVTSALTVGTAYRLTVENVADRAAEPNVAPATGADFTFRERLAISREGLQALYTFDEGEGATVRDVSGVGEPLDLEVSDGTAVEWADGALKVTAPALIASASPTTKLIEACREANALTVEAWVRPAALDQAGPARIVSLSKDTGSRNFTLGQTDTTYIARLRTTTTSTNGIPELVSPEGTLTRDLTHVVDVRDSSGIARIYVDGAEKAVGAARGDLSNWDTSLRLALANEMTSDRTWLGEFQLVALYSRALSWPEIVEHYTGGPDVRVGTAE